MEDRHLSIKNLAMECPKPIMRRYAWGLGIILTISGLMTLLPFNKERKERSSIPTQLELKSLTHYKKDSPLHSFLTLPNGELLDVSTPLNLYSSLFTPHEALRRSVSASELSKLEEFTNLGGSCDNNSVEAFIVNNVITNPKCEQGNKEKPASNELNESLKSAPLVDIENKIKANNLIGKIEANIEGLKDKFKGNNDVGAIKVANSNELKDFNKADNVRMGGITKVDLEGKGYKRSQFSGFKERIKMTNSGFEGRGKDHIDVLRGKIQSKCRGLVVLFCLLMFSCVLSSCKVKEEEPTENMMYVKPFAPIRYFF